MGDADARLPAVGAGENGVMHEVVHRREGLRLDVSFCEREAGRRRSARRRKARGRGPRNRRVTRGEKTREDDDDVNVPPCDATRYPRRSSREMPGKSRRASRDVRVTRGKKPRVSTGASGAVRRGARAAGKRVTGLFFLGWFGARTFARHLRLADVFVGDLRWGSRAVSDC